MRDLTVHYYQTREGLHRARVVVDMGEWPDGAPRQAQVYVPAGDFSRVCEDVRAVFMSARFGGVEQLAGVGFDVYWLRGGTRV